MTKKQDGRGPETRSNAANGTKTIWVESELHAVLKTIGKEEGRTIRMTAERLLLAQLGFSNMQDLRNRTQDLRNRPKEST